MAMRTDKIGGSTASGLISIDIYVLRCSLGDQEETCGSKKGLCWLHVYGMLLAVGLLSFRATIIALVTVFIRKTPWTDYLSTDVRVNRVLSRIYSAFIILTILINSVHVNLLQVISMDSIMTCCACLSTETSRRTRITCSWATTWTEANSHWRRSVCCLPTK